MAQRSFLKRVTDALRRVVGLPPSEPAPEAAAPPAQPPQPPRRPPGPPAPPPPQEPEEPEYDRPGFFDEVPPEESGIPPGPGDEGTAYDHLGADMGISQDAYAMDLLWFGWFADDVSSDQRVEARQMFFDYTGMDNYDFDWDQWRDWYSETAA